MNSAHLPPIYLLRHGETEWNKLGRLQGRLDSALTARGLQQARNMAATLKAELDPAFDWHLVSSPQPRARNTADIVGGHCGLPVATDERLCEASMGLWEGLTGTEIDSAWPNPSGVYRFLQAPEGETFADVSGRVLTWLDDLKQPTIAVSHGITGKVIRALYLGIDVAQLPSMAHKNQDGLFRLAGGQVDFFECIDHCESADHEYPLDLPAAPRRNRVEPR